MRALDRKLVRDLGRMKAQVLAIALVMGAGIALFVTMSSAFDSLELTRETYYERHRFADVFASLVRAPDRLEARIAAIPGVATVQTRVVAPVTVDLPGIDEPLSGRLISVPADRRPALNDLFLERGRWLEPRRRDEVLLSAGFADAHGIQPGDALPVVVHGRRRDLQVVGIALSPEYVYTLRPGELFPDAGRFPLGWMDERALASAWDMEGGFNDVALALDPGASLDRVIDHLDRLLEPWGGRGAIPRAQQTSHWYLESELAQLQGMGTVVPGLFLAVAAFLLHVVLSRIVRLEREQIAALKALGYPDRTIAGHYVRWAVATSLIGAVVGVGAGVWLGSAMTELYTEFFAFPILRYRLLPSTALVAVLVSVVAAVLGAVGAVRRVVSLPPAEAMRPEPPATYRRSALESAAGIGALFRRLSQPSRIILRNLRRRPVRAGLSALGIAMAGALVIVGGFSWDAVNRALHVQFDLAQRYDAVVTFTEPVSSRARFELQRLPGVLAVEPVRSVAVRLSAGHRSRQVGLQGARAEGELSRIVDLDGRVVTPPAEGLLLSAALADILAVRPGDPVHVEVLELGRPVVATRVGGIVDDSFGTSAWIDQDALHDLLGEAQTLSGAHLRLDRSREDELFAALAAMPAVAGMGLERRAMENFEETTGESIGIVRAIVSVFAVIIAFGVVYNTARTSLSERSRELATLRVLGFTRREIGFILLGELALVTVFAVVLGLVLGWLLAQWTSAAMQTEMYRLPAVVTPATHAWSALVVLAAAALSGLAVARRLTRLDLIAVLKTRE